MTDRKTKKWLSFVVIVAFVLMANVAIGSLLLRDNKQTASAALSAKTSAESRLSVGEMKIGDYISGFGNFNGHDLIWRIVGQDDEGNKLIRTDRALANEDGTTFTIKFDDVSSKSPQQLDAYYNRNVTTPSTTNPETKRRDQIGTNLWEQASIREWLNSNFLSNSQLDQTKLLQKTQSQLLWWGDAQDGGQNTESYGQGQRNTAGLSMDARSSTNGSRYNFLTGVQGVDNPLSNVRGSIPHRYVHTTGNIITNYDQAYQYDINDLVTLLDVKQADAISRTGEEILRNANGDPYVHVLKPDYDTSMYGTPEAGWVAPGGDYGMVASPSDDFAKGHVAPTVTTWLRTPLATSAQTLNSNDVGQRWSLHAGRLGTAARVSGDDDKARNPVLNVDSAAENVDQERGVAPTVWLKADQSFQYVNDAPNNPNEKVKYYSYSDTIQTLEKQTPIATLNYLQKSNIDLSKQIGEMITDITADAGSDVALINSATLRYTGIGAFPRGLALVTPDEIWGLGGWEDGANQVTIQGAPSLIDQEKTDEESNQTSFTFSLVLSTNAGFSATKVITIDIKKGDPSAYGEFATVDNSTNNNLTYGANNALFGLPGKINYAPRVMSETYVAITDEDNATNQFVAQAPTYNNDGDMLTNAEGAYGVYKDLLNAHSLPTPQWSWDNPTDELGDANIPSTVMHMLDNDVETTIVNKHSATYRDPNADLITIKREPAFKVEQGIPEHATPVDFVPDVTVQNTWGVILTNINNQFANGTQDIDKGTFVLVDEDTASDVIRFSETNAQGFAIALNPVNFKPDSKNYALSNTSAIAMNSADFPEEYIQISATNVIAQFGRENAVYGNSINASPSAIFTGEFDVDGEIITLTAPIRPTYELVSQNGDADELFSQYGISFNPASGAFAGSFRTSTTTPFSIVANAKVGTTIKASAINITGITIDKAKIDISQVPARPQDGQIRATYGQKLSDVQNQISDNRFTFANPNALVGDASETIVDDEPVNQLREAAVIYNHGEHYYAVTEGLFVKIQVDKANAQAPTAPTIADVQYDPAKTLGDIELPDGWSWVNPDYLVGNITDVRESSVQYNPDPRNYNTSAPVSVVFKVVGNPEKTPNNTGLIIGIVAGVVVLVAAGVIAFVMINKKKQTSTKVGSRGNRI